jgi:hypothetical protein
MISRWLATAMIEGSIINNDDFMTIPVIIIQRSPPRIAPEEPKIIPRFLPFVFILLYIGCFYNFFKLF